MTTFEGSERLSMLKVRELTVRLENHPGTLAQIATLDGRCDGEYPQFSAHYVRSRGWGRLVVDNVDNTKEALKNGGVFYAEQLVLQARLGNVPGHWDGLLES